MRYFIIGIFIFALASVLHSLNGQNLILNYSFEYHQNCMNRSIINAKPWFQPNTFSGSTDYFNECIDTLIGNGSGIPYNYTGYQYAKTGVAYAGFAAYGHSSINPGKSRAREYLEVMLIDSLIAGKKYMVSFYVSLGNKSKFAVETIGAYLSKDSLLYYSTNFDALTQYIPQLINKTGFTLRDTMNWVLISDTLIAKGGERFMTIGNFNTDSTSNVDTLVKPTSTYTFAYYYIDDVSVIPDTTTGIDEHENFKGNIFLYPNPNNGSMFFSYTFQQNEKGALSLYDITGRKIKTYKLKEDKNVLEINEPLQAGVYFYKVMVNEKVVYHNKVVVIR